MSSDFYKNMKSFSDFSEITSDEYFSRVPDNWYVVMTDVRGSTKAIEEGRYKEVNLMGAASVTCLLNAFDNQSIPFVFGGDGATLLVEDKNIEGARRELGSLKALSKSEFNLELRVGFVPVRKLYELGAELMVGKFELSPGNYTAQFKGGGLTLAEEMLKKGIPAGAERVELTGNESEPNLAGLSCRLNPLESKNGVMLSILIKPLGNNLEIQKIMSEVLQKLKNILSNDFQSASPVQKTNISWKLIPKSLSAEIKTQKRNKIWIVQFFITFIRVITSQILLSFNIPMGPFRPEKYKLELIQNSDSKKFDETLRMVVDCSIEQKNQIREFLEPLYKNNKLKYGLHESSTALMTCVVFSASQNQHVHFIDGGDGGYALAAVQLKKA